MGYIKIKYPCGHEIEAKGWFLDCDMSGDDYQGCPLHGHNCYSQTSKHIIKKIVKRNK